MSAAAGGGGYMTRGRAADYERRLAAIEARFEERCRQLEARVDGLAARQLDLPRALAAAAIETVRTGTGDPQPAAVPEHRRGAR